MTGPQPLLQSLRRRPTYALKHYEDSDTFLFLGPEMSHMGEMKWADRCVNSLYYTTSELKKPQHEHPEWILVLSPGNLTEPEAQQCGLQGSRQPMSRSASLLPVYSVALEERIIESYGEAERSGEEGSWCHLEQETSPVRG